MGSGIWDLGSGIWDLGSGIWDLEDHSCIGTMNSTLLKTTFADPAL